MPYNAFNVSKTCQSFIINIYNNLRGQAVLSRNQILIGSKRNIILTHTHLNFYKTFGMTS